MPIKTDKRTSNLFIAGGYCLVAIIILFNYLGETESKERVRTTLAASAAEGVPDAQADALVRQLEEEKRVNMEMREMIRRLQTAIGDKAQPAGVVEPVAASHGIYEIPEIKANLIENIGKQRSNPFIPGKNPFAASRPKNVSQDGAIPDNALAHSLQCDPRLPFIITGANSKSAYFANY